MLLILFISLCSHILLQQINSIDYPYLYTFNKLLYIPNPSSLTTQQCKQIQFSSTRIYCLGKSNTINSWKKDGTGYTQYNSYDVAPPGDYIHQFHITTNQSRIVFALNGFDTIYTLSATDLTLISITHVGGYQLTSALKIGPQYVFITVRDPLIPNNHIGYYANQSDLILSSTIGISINGPLKIKLNTQQTAVVLWNSNGQICFVNIDGLYSGYTTCISGTFINAPTQTDVIFSSDGTRLVIEWDNVYNLMVFQLQPGTIPVLIQNVSMPFVIQKIQFIDNNSVIAVFHDTNVTYYRVDTMSRLVSYNIGQSYGQFLRIDVKTYNLIYCVNSTIFFYSPQCQSNQFITDVDAWSCYSSTPLPIINNITNISNNLNISNNISTNLNVSNSTNTPNTPNITNSTNNNNLINNPLTNITVISPQNNQNLTVSASVSILNSISLSTLQSPASNNTNSASNSSSNTNSASNMITNITIPLSNNTSTNNTTISNTTNNNSIIHIVPINQNQTIYISSQTQILFSFSQNTLSSQIFSLVNSIPGSRRLLRPLFIFFTNFDDIWLYNYIDINFNPVMQNLFDTIQSLQQQKWNIIPFQTIWSQWFGLNIQQNITLVNNYIRRYFTSPKFLTIQNRQNGYLLNTLQFFLSSIIVMILIFLTGYLLFKITSHFNLKLKNSLKQYSLVLYFPIFCLEGSVQYMSYLFGFELYNLWASDFTNKLYSFLIVSWIFLFLFLNSTIYFFFKYAYQQRANDCYQNSDSGIKGIFYWIFIGGIRNLVLGFVQFFLPQDKNVLIFKYMCLVGIQMIFFGPMVYFISGKRKFFIKKIRQWLMLSIGLLRILLILTFGLDLVINIKGNEGYLVSIISDIYSIMLFIYMSFWIVSLIYEISILIIEIFGHIASINVNNQIQKNNLNDRTKLIFFKSDGNFKGKNSRIKKINTQQSINNGKLQQQKRNKIIKKVKQIRFEQQISVRQQKIKAFQQRKQLKRIKQGHTKYKTVLRIYQQKKSKLTFIKLQQNNII